MYGVNVVSENINDCLVPNSFNQISDTIKAKIKKEYNISDVDYKGSNISILIDMLAYAISIGNTNLNFGINESILQTATTKKNIVNLARSLGYEPKRKMSYKYKIKLKAKANGDLLIPKFSTFKDESGIPYIYTGDDITYSFGCKCQVDILNEHFYELLKQKTEIDAGSQLITNDGEVISLLKKSQISNNTEILVSLDDIETPLSLYSKQNTSIYYKVDDEYMKIGDIETFVYDDTNENNPKLIIQMKNLQPINIPLQDEWENTPLFTDDMKFIEDVFEGFKAESFDENSEILTIDLNEYPIFDEISQFKKKRLAVIGIDNPDLEYREINEVCVVKSSNIINACELIVTQGELISYTTNPDLQIYVTEQIQKRGYIILDYEDIEQNGVFLNISRVNKNNELILKQPFQQREEYLPPQGFEKEDTTFLVLNEFTNRYNFLKIFTSFANTGTKLYAGNICYFNLIKSLGRRGEAVGLISPDSIGDSFEAINVEENGDKIVDKVLYSIGSDEEDNQSIKDNAPLFKNLAERLVTKRDYKTFLLTIPFIEKGQVWGGEELESPRIGHVFFTFIPISRPKDFSHNANLTHFYIEQWDNRDLFFLPEKQIVLAEDGGMDDSIFEMLSRRKIITLQYHNVPPAYVDFVLYVKIIKYQAGISEIDLRDQIFNRIHEYFKDIETFDAQIFESNIVKIIDQQFNNQSGIALKTAMSVDFVKSDFFKDGENPVEVDSAKYKVEFLFEFPVDGIFTENIYNVDGSVGEYGRLILSRLPIIKCLNFVADGDKLEFDYSEVVYQVLEYGKLTTKQGTIDDITSNVKKFSIPIYHNCDNVDNTSVWSGKKTMCGALVAYPATKIIHIEIYGTDSQTDEDLEIALPMDVFDEKKTINIQCDVNMQFRFQSFPRLKEVFFVDNFE